MEAPLTLLYTYGIRGDLNLLPRVYTFIRTLRDDLSGRSLLIDLGMSCVPEVWPCGVTEGRSTLFVMDAMGYDVANVSGVLSAGSRAKIVDHVTTALVDENHPHVQDGILFACVQGVDPSHQGLRVNLSTAGETFVDGSTLHLAPVDAGQIGSVGFDGTITHHRVHTLSPNTPPDPTISGTVDFVRGEARQFERKHG